MGNLSPQLLAGLVVIGITAALAVVTRFKSAMWLFGAMILAASLAPTFDSGGRAVSTWLSPIQMRRSEIFAAGGLLLLMASVFHLHRIKFHRITFPGVILVIIALWAAIVRIIAGGDIVSGGQAAAFAILTIVPAVILLPSLIETREDALRFLRVIAIVSALWAAACAVQFTIRPKVLTMLGVTRFQGLLANPQHAGSYLAFMVVSLAFLMLNDTRITLRPIWTGLAGLNAVLLMWTGSRTGLGMTIIGLVSVLYTRLGRSIIFLPIAGLALVGTLSVVETTGTLNLGRLTSTENTRGAAWQGLWQQFLDNPVFGAGSSESAVHSENSVLYALASYGFLMGLFVIAMLIATTFRALAVYRARFSLRDPLEKRLADLFAGFCAMYVAGSMLEGYVISRVSSPMAIILAVLAIGAYVSDRAREEHAAELEAAWTPSPDDSTALSDSALAEHGEEDHPHEPRPSEAR